MQSLQYLLSQLPKPAQKQVFDFVEFLIAKYKKKEVSNPSPIDFPLKNSIIKYENPFEPVGADDWEAYA